MVSAMRCPACKKSLWFVKDVCPFCKAILSPEPESRLAAPDKSGGECLLVTLTQCATLPEADAVRAHLASVGITTFLPDESLLQTVAWNLNTYGYVRVQVKSADYQIARRELLAMQQAAAAVNGTSADSTETMPLSMPEKCFAFAMGLLTCPGLLFFLVIRSGYKRQTYERKATDMILWYIAGVFCAIVIIFVLVLFNASP